MQFEKQLKAWQDRAEFLKNKVASMESERSRLEEAIRHGLKVRKALGPEKESDGKSGNGQAGPIGTRKRGLTDAVLELAKKEGRMRASEIKAKLMKMSAGYSEGSINTTVHRLKRSGVLKGFEDGTVGIPSGKSRH